MNLPATIRPCANLFWLQHGFSDFTLKIPRQLISYVHSDGTKFADVTPALQRIASDSGVKEGILFLKNQSTNSAVVIQEANQFVENDIAEILGEYSKPYSLTSLFQTYQALPIKDWKLVLGTYQSVILIVQNGSGKPELLVTPVPAELESRVIDTGLLDSPVFERNKNNYEKKGSEMVFDITSLLIKNAIQHHGPEGFVYLGAGNTTLVLHHDKDDLGVEALVNCLDGIVKPECAYAHNNIEARRIRSELPVDERPNGRSHVLASLLSTSLILPASGPVGRVYLFELDGPRDKRIVHIGVAKNVSYQALINAR